MCDDLLQFVRHKLLQEASRVSDKRARSLWRDWSGRSLSYHHGWDVITLPGLEERLTRVLDLREGEKAVCYAKLYY